MLNHPLFINQVTSIGEVLRGWPSTPTAQAIYYKAIAHLSDRTFCEICDLICVDCDWFPTPKWILEQATTIAQRRRTESKLLPFAPIDELEASCPEYVRIYMQRHLAEGRDLLAHLAGARALSRQRLRSSGLSPSNLGQQVEADPEVVAIKAKLDAHWNKGTPHHWAGCQAQREMAAIRDAADELVLEVAF